MRLVMISVLVISLLALLILLFRRRGARRALNGFVMHGIAAFVLLYAVNRTGWIPGVEIPTNPATLVTVGVLGVPGLAAITFLKMVWY